MKQTCFSPFPLSLHATEGKDVIEKSWSGAYGGSSELCADVSYDGELLGTTAAQGTKWHPVNSVVHTDTA